LDGSTYWFCFLLVVITKWLFLPINAYEVNEEIIRDLKEQSPTKQKVPGWDTTLIIMSISAIIAKIIQRVVSNLNLGENFNIIYLYMIPIIFIGYFTISRHLKKRK